MEFQLYSSHINALFLGRMNCDDYCLMQQNVVDKTCTNLAFHSLAL